MKMKNVWLVTKSECIRFVKNPRLILLVILFLVMYRLILLPFSEAMNVMEQPVNLLEAPIAVANNWILVLLIALVYLILISSFPTVDGNSNYYLTRMGRRNWMMGELLFLVIATIGYVILVLGSAIAFFASNAFFANGWSTVVSEYDQLYGDMGNKMSSILPENLYYQMAPFEAFMHSVFLVFLLLLFCGLLFFLGCISSKRLLYFVIQVAHIAIGGALSAVYFPVMWLFPFTHALLVRHYRMYMREYYLSPNISVWILAGGCFVLIYFILRKIKTCNLSTIGGSVLG